jgi:uncharacterized membrane protein YedE/YeeE/rhodanese-related sulfurtransferase
MSTIFPLELVGEQWRLLSGLGIGLFFGFSLERAGFGNARKLAGQFYLNDMAVFKVMFTAVLVAMTGVFSLASFGLLELGELWINPTFIWAQVVAGFILGLGFVMSGLCPGTAMVSVASGKLDGLVTVLGTFFGIFVFTLVFDKLSWLQKLYSAGSGEVILLNEIFPFRFPAICLVMTIILVATGAFFGAEIVEKIFSKKLGRGPLTPPDRPRMKYYVMGSLFLVALTAAFYDKPAEPEAPPLNVLSMEPLVLAERIIDGDPGLQIFDLRETSAFEAKNIPGARLMRDLGNPADFLETLPEGATVLLYDESSAPSTLPGTWPEHLNYLALRGGFSAWRDEVLTALESTSSNLEEREFILRQNQMAGYFSGTRIKSKAAAPPPLPAGAAKKKKKPAGGC